jgi:ATPase family associated with various cellular activities (AAA)
MPLFRRSPSIMASEISQPPEESQSNTSEVKGEDDKIQTGMLVETKSLYQKKDSDNKFQWVTEEPDDAVDAAESPETAKYAFLVRNKKSYDSRKKYEIDSIIVQSPLLKKALGIALEKYPGITTTLDRLVFKAPFACFVHRWQKFADLLTTTEDETARKHLQLLYDVLEAELKDAIHAKNDLVKNGVITFDHLWTIFEPGELVYSTDEDKERLYELQSTTRCTDQKRGVDYLRIQARGIDWDGEKFGTAWAYLSDYEFEGTRPITSLTAFPFEFHPQKEQLSKALTARGKLFEKFAGYHYQAYQGVALGYGRCGLIKHNVDSRVIIDCAAHNAFLPNNAVFFNALGRQVDVPSQSNDNDESDQESNYDSSEDSSYVYTPQDGDDTAGSKPGHRPLTSKELLLTVPYVRGYAIKNKKWLIFFVDQIRPIVFSTNAFSSLVLPAQQKDLIQAFVSSQVKHKSTFDDVIAGKGRGMIMLLSGPPGVGKTLTAESVAENMQVPLYMLSAGDLGLEPSEIEETLNTILEMVAKWNAVLLLDEADVFLESRSTGDLERNKMVSIFLRMLEYFQGVLFLTTNRLAQIDEAFHSRIHVSLQYPGLSAESRRHVWKTFVGGNERISERDLDELSEVELNGRQIKNILKTAQMLAQHRGEDKGVGMEHIRTVMAIERR